MSLIASNIEKTNIFKKLTIVILLGCFFHVNYVFAMPKINKSLVGIIVPMEKESIYLRKHIKHQQNVVINGIHYIRGELCGHQIIFVQSGVGMINAAIISVSLIQEFHPKLVIMLGSAGAVNKNLRIGDVVIGDKVINADIGRLTDSGPVIKQSLLFNAGFNLDIPDRFNLNKELYTLLGNINFKLPNNKIIWGTIATSNIIPSNFNHYKLLKKDKVDVVEMEGVSLMHACYIYNMQCVVVRSVSDIVGKSFKHKTIFAGENVAKIAMQIIQKGLIFN